MYEHIIEEWLNAKDVCHNYPYIVDELFRKAVSNILNDKYRFEDENDTFIDGMSICCKRYIIVRKAGKELDELLESGNYTDNQLMEYIFPVANNYVEDMKNWISDLKAEREKRIKSIPTFKLVE